MTNDKIPACRQAGKFQNKFKIQKYFVIWNLDLFCHWEFDIWICDRQVKPTKEREHMLCAICQKKQATVHLTEIVDEVMAELHLCEDCAKEKSIKMEQQFSLADLISGLSDFGKQAEDLEKVKLVCNSCGMTYENFRKTGRLGCSDCYVSFKKYLASLLKKIHGSSQHLGKSPSRLPKVAKVKSELQELKSRLQYLIETEAFEEAAKLRDKIKELENQEKGTR